MCGLFFPLRKKRDRGGSGIFQTGSGAFRVQFFFLPATGVSSGQAQQKEFTGDLYELLCEVREIPEELKETYRGYFTERKDDEAVKHLFDLACGLDSRILGEDQIITQVKDALAMARDQLMRRTMCWKFCSAWRCTAAKKVKTEVVLSDANQFC